MRVCLVFTGLSRPNLCLASNQDEFTMFFVVQVYTCIHRHCIVMVYIYMLINLISRPL